jgi:SAM-dependent methyltransferase
MNNEFLNILRCPQSGQALNLQANELLVTKDGKYNYPIRNGIPRFVPEANYANNFGIQWNHFRQTQLDSYSGHPISADRFWNATGWKPEDLKDKWVLDGGCGAGRFAEVALSAGAKVVALDYSSAVDACYANLRDHPNLHVVQGDIYALPFLPKSFSFVYSLGVLQHTPNVEKAFMELTLMLCPTGGICVDYYWRRFQTMLHSKYLLRPVTKRMTTEQVFKILERWIPTLLKTSQVLGSIPIAGRVLQRIVPVADYTKFYPLSSQQLLEWALLDTFDMLCPAYDNPQTPGTIRRWCTVAGLVDIEILHVGHLVSRGYLRP